MIVNSELNTETLKEYKSGCYESRSDAPALYCPLYLYLMGETDDRWEHV